MKIVAGLGNPGREYAATRHNIGFMAVDELARRWGITDWQNRQDALVAEKRGEDRILLVKPQTFMNLSGVAVGELARWYKVAPQDVIVLHDDMDLAAGRLRVKIGGHSAGHRGVESVIVHLGPEFVRVRMGIGRPTGDWEVVAFVLARFAAEEEEAIAGLIGRAADAVEYMAVHGAVKTMNRFNRG